MNRSRPFPVRNAVAGLCLLLVWTSSLAAVPIVGEVTNTFSDGTTGEWEGRFFGFTPGPMVVDGGGPAGPNDTFLEFSTNNFHLAMRNDGPAWTGDYLAAGVEAIGLDLIQLSGDVDVQLQLSLHGPGGMFVCKERTPVLLKEGWMHHVFSLHPDDMAHVARGTGNLEDTLRSVGRILIRHDNATPSPPGFHPPHIVASVGVDNIAATCLTTAVSDLNGDCVTDFRDFAIFAEGWLQ